MAGMEYSLTGQQHVTEEDQGAIRPPSGSKPSLPQPLVSRPRDNDHSCMHIGSIYDGLTKPIVTNVSKLQLDNADSLMVSTYYMIQYVLRNLFRSQ